MKKNIWLSVLALLILTGCKININSPQSARDDNYGETTQASTSINEVDDKLAGTMFSKKGSGDDVFTNLAFKKGPVIANITFKGTEKRVVRIVDSDGQEIAKLIDTQGNYIGKTMAQIPKDADTYILEIKAEGSWSIQFSEANTKANQ